MSSLIAVAGRGKSAGPNGSIIVEAGWNTPDCYLEGVALMKVENRLKSLRIQTEMTGTCETRWEIANALATDSTKLATEYESDDYKILKNTRIFQQSYDLVLESKEPVFPDPTGAAISFPFKFKLPKNDMPPSFDHPSGSVWYTLKTIASFYEGKNFTKSTVEFEVPMTVVMPEPAKLKILNSPTPIDQFVPATASVCAYSLQIPTTVVTVGDTVRVNLTVSSTPQNARLRSLPASLNIAAGFSSAKTTVGFNHSSTNKEATFARFPRPVAEIAETFQFVKIGGNGGVTPIVRQFELFVDPEVALASFGSQLIAVNTIFRLQITTDDSDTPNVHLEVPIIVLPEAIARIAAPVAVVHPTPKGLPIQPTQPNPLVPPSVTQSPLPTPRQYASPLPTAPIQVTPNPQPVYQAPAPRSPPLSPVMTPKLSAQQTPTLEDQLLELQKLKEEQAKLSILLAEVQKLEIPQARAIPQYDAATIHSRARSIAEDSDSVFSQEPTADWSVEMVAEWVKQKGASEEVVQSFKAQEIDGSILVTLTADDLRNELKVTALGLRRKILMAIEKLRG